MYRTRRNYAENLLSTDVLGPARSVSVQWKEDRAVFRLGITRIDGNPASLPENENAILRDRYYSCFFQGVFGGAVFYEHRALFGDTLISPPVEILEMVGYIYDELVPLSPSVVPEIKLIVPLNHRVELQSLTLGYTN